MARYYVYREDGELMRFSSKNELLEHALGGWNPEQNTYPATTKKEALRLAYDQFVNPLFNDTWSPEE